MNIVEIEAKKVKDKVDSILYDLYQSGEQFESLEIRLGYRAAASLEIACGRGWYLSERVTINGHRAVYQNTYCGIPVVKVAGDLDFIEVRQ